MDLNDYLYSFLIGGAFCVVAQIFIDKSKVTAARILVSYVVIGVLLTAIGVYEPIVEFGRSGATVPLTGFGYALAKGVEKAVGENGLLGALTGGLKATSAGVTASFAFALLWALMFKSKEK
ncbi:MAG TPA: stage V sporulation protein AE [Clostridiales bacterium]|nr:MAG: stage V sporulation protein AE [Candidatus Margulisbacteria bacterium GWF2_35_9]HAN21481.1 stage V sporulation protein AE [Clostridiales bacterium]